MPLSTTRSDPRAQEETDEQHQRSVFIMGRVCHPCPRPVLLPMFPTVPLVALICAVTELARIGYAAPLDVIQDGQCFSVPFSLIRRFSPSRGMKFFDARL